MTAHLAGLRRVCRLAVVCGSDASTAGAVMRAVEAGFVEALFVGDCAAVRQQPCVSAWSGGRVSYIEAGSQIEAAELAVTMVRQGQADLLMKGLLHTDTLLRAVLNNCLLYTSPSPRD